MEKIMNGQLLKIGDRVCVIENTPLPTRGIISLTTSTPQCPPGTQGTVQRFYSYFTGFTYNGAGKKPGKHLDREKVFVKLTNGDILPIHAHFLELADRAEMTKREEYYRQLKLTTDINPNHDFIGDHPDTKIWEGDTVVTLSGETEFVYTVDYDKWVDGENNDDKPIYNIGEPGFGEEWLSANDLSLLQRGEHWRRYHEEIHR